jgi:hypothetical protein
MAQDGNGQPASTRLCSLEEAVGRAVVCGERACAFWEPGGAVLHGRCAFERLELGGRSELAEELLRIQAFFDSAESAHAEQAARHLYHRLLNESGGE